jgi:hypothetical protein
VKPRLIDDSSRAPIGLVIAVAGLGAGALALAGATGKLDYLAERLPHPTANGWALFVLAVIAGGAWWRMYRTDTPAHEFDELAYRRQRPRKEKWPVSDERWHATWPVDVGEVGPAADGSFCKGQLIEFDPSAPERRVYLSPLRPRSGRQVRS